MKVIVDWKSHFLTYVSPEPNSGCWLWTGSCKEKGYGLFSRPGKGSRSAHRFSYTAFVGEIPRGYQIDHKCRVPSCVNPAHLEAVTPAENNKRSQSFSAVNARKTHCKRGHALTPDNIAPAYIRHGWRICITCKRLTDANRRLMRGKSALFGAVSQ